MFLFLGEDTVVLKENIVAIFDMDKASVSKSTRDYLKKMQKENKVISVTKEIPKSFVVCMEKNKEKIYLSQLAPSTLKIRNYENIK